MGSLLPLRHSRRRRGHPARRLVIAHPRRTTRCRDEPAKVAAYKLRPEPRVPTPSPGRTQQPVHRRYRLNFTKTGDARFLSHRQMMDALERVIRAAGLPVRYTEGFNPHIRLSMGPALSVGHEGAAEIFDVDCTAPSESGAHLQGELLAAGGCCDHQRPGFDARSTVAGQDGGQREIPASLRCPGTAPGRRPPTTSSLNCEGPFGCGARLKTAVSAVELNARQQAGPTPSVKKLLIALGFDDIEAARLRVTREGFVLRRKGEAPIPTPAQQVPAPP